MKPYKRAIVLKKEEKFNYYCKNVDLISTSKFRISSFVRISLARILRQINEQTALLR